MSNTPPQPVPASNDSEEPRQDGAQDAEQPREFDLSVHLVGDQPIPAYLAIQHLPAPRRLFVCSHRTVDVARRVARSAGLDRSAYELLTVDPHDLASTREQLAAHPSLLEAKAPVFDLTGGTKLMWAAGDAVSRATPKARSLYVETSRRQLWWLDTLESEPLRPVMTVEAFVRLAGLKVLGGRAGGVTEERRDLATLLWAHRADFSSRKTLQEFVRLADDRQKVWIVTARRGLEVESFGDHGLEVRRSGVVLWRTANPWPEAAAYFGGLWLEEYALCMMEPLRAVEDLKELVIGLEVQTALGANYQELDLVACDGYQLTVVECKSGSVNQIAIQKLENVVREIGGVYGRGLLVSSFPVKGGSAVAQRIQRSRTISAFGGRAVEVDLAARALSVRPGAVLR